MNSTNTTTDVAPQPMGSLSRIFGIFWEPKRTFENIAASPSWWAPLILLILLGLVFMIAFQQTVGFDTFLEQQMAKEPRLQDLSEEQRAQAMAMQSKIMPFMMFGGAVVAAPVIYLLTALFTMLAFRIMAGSQVTFKQSFAISTHAWLPTGVSAMLAILVMQFVHPSDFDLENPVMLNLGWLVDSETTSAWLYGLLSSIDVFSFWVMALLAMGFAAATRKLRFGKAYTIVVSLWLVMIVIKVGWLALMR